MNSKAIRNGRRVEEIVHFITDKILNGPLSPGERLGEKDLAVRFGTSRGPVRQALQRLEVNGLVCFTPNVGARVAFYTLSDYINLFIARECMEGMAARLAAVSMTAVEKSNLRQLVHVHEEHFKMQPEGSYVQPRADIDFHHAIIRGSRNPLLFNMLCGELYPLFQLCRRLHRHILGRGRRALVEHVRILEAIDDADDEMAEMMMRRHIAAARACVETIFIAEDMKLIDSKLLNSRPSLLKWEKISFQDDWSSSLLVPLEEDQQTSSP